MGTGNGRDGGRVNGRYRVYSGDGEGWKIMRNCRRGGGNGDGGRVIRSCKV